MSFREPTALWFALLLVVPLVLYLLPDGQIQFTR